jgi:hypothetical protein
MKKEEKHEEELRKLLEIKSALEKTFGKVNSKKMVVKIGKNNGKSLS